MKKILFAIFLILVLSSADRDPKAEYIAKYSGIAVSEMQRSGVPASITLAQGILESRAGLSPLAEKGNNHFGVKCHKDWKGKKMYQDDDARHECFRVYPDAESSFRDHSDFLRYQERYKSLFDLKPTDYKAWAKGLKNAGYATDPAYTQKLIKLIEDYDLSRFDRGTQVAVEAPSIVEAPVEVKDYQPSGKTGFQESVRVVLARKVFKQNGVPFVYAIEGDTYSSIAKSYRLFLKEILRDNDVAADRRLGTGEIVYIDAKKKKAARGVDKYIIGPGERITLWNLSQKYGIKLKSLTKLNALSANAVLEEGETIVLR